MSSETSWPASITALALRPSSVPRATASRSRSPEDTCGTPYLACRRCACVPLPEPGAPSNTIRISRPDPPQKEALPYRNRPRHWQRPGYPSRAVLRSRDRALKHRLSTMPAKTAPPSPATPSTPSPAASPPSSTPPPAASSRPPQAQEPHRQGLRRPARHRRRADRGPDRHHARNRAAAIRALRHTPAGAFGSARYKLKKFEDNPRAVRAADRGLQGARHRLLLLQRRRRLGRHLPEGLAAAPTSSAIPIQAIHVPKTVDNDLPITDCCPGFGSVAKYVAVSIREAGYDVASMAKTSTKVFIMEVMGRHAGWIAAAGGLAAEKDRRCAAHHPVSRNHVRRREVLRARQGVRREVRLLRRRRLRRRARTRTASSSPMRACAMRSATRSSAASRR